MKWIAAFCAVAFAVNAQGADWTAYVVINGDNYSEMTDEATGQTEPMAPKVFRQFEEQALKNKNVDTVILYDPGEDSGVGLFKWPQASVLEFISGGEVVAREKLGETNLADPETISDMIQWGQELSRPGAESVLYFWSHHISVTSLAGEDDPTKTFDYSHPSTAFTTETLRKALTDGGVHFNAIIMSTCYGTTLEALIQMQDLTDYYVGTASRLLYDGGLSRDFLSILDSRPTKTSGTQAVLKQVYDQAIAAYLRPRSNPIAQRLVPKVNPYPVIFSLAEVQRFRTLWRGFIEFTEEQYGWYVSSIIDRSYLVNSNGSISQNWLDVLRFFSEWKRFLADRHSNLNDPVAISGIVQIQEMERTLKRMILRQNESSLTIFVPRQNIQSLVRLVEFSDRINQQKGGIK